jgi:magnesium chelatase family protein
MHNSGFEFPDGTVTVNLAPADVRKQGSAYDLAVAIGVIAAMRPRPTARLERTLFLGELALDGSVRSVRGVLPIAATAARKGLGSVVVPEANGAEAALVKDVSAHSVRTLHEAVDFLEREDPAPLVFRVPSECAGASRELADLSEVRGQRAAKRALEIAAAGGHNLLLVGPPGSGKSLLAMRLPSLLPPLRFDDALEVTKIYSVAGLLDGGAFCSRAPFRAPHHTISTAAMVGGGPRSLPGEVSLAHRGVLFLDELPEFPRAALESLRQPMEDGRVRIRRVNSLCSLPARFTLVAAMNPCPCGFHGAESRPCECRPGAIQRYQRKISGPLLDRIDLRVPVRPLRAEEMLAPATASAQESSRAVRRRVALARGAQEKRFRRGRLNAAMTPAEIDRRCELDAAGKSILERAVARLGLSTRGFHRVLKVARTIADLADARAIEPMHLQEAIHFRAEGPCDTIRK